MSRFLEYLHDHYQTVIAAGILIVIGWSAFVAAGIYVRETHRQMQLKTDQLVEEVASQTKSSFKSIQLLNSSEATLLKTYRNAVHVERAQALGIERLPDRDAARKRASSDELVRLNDTPYYVVAEMTHSVPYVTPSTANLMELIGVRFHDALREAGLPPYRYIITSATRTRADQRALQGVNVNAAVESSHEYGTTVDLHYQQFNFPENVDLMADTTGIYHSQLNERLIETFKELAMTRQQKLKALLGRVLLELQNEGKVLVIYERVQPVYHITVGREIEPPRSEPEIRPASRAGVVGALSTAP